MAHWNKIPDSLDIISISTVCCELGGLCSWFTVASTSTNLSLKLTLSSTSAALIIMNVVDFPSASSTVAWTDAGWCMSPVWLALSTDAVMHSFLCSKNSPISWKTAVQLPHINESISPTMKSVTCKTIFYIGTFTALLINNEESQVLQTSKCH